MLNEEKILDVKINTGLNWDSLLNYIEEHLLGDKKPHYICTTNPEFVMEAQRDPSFKDIINNADLSIPDGVGILQALYYVKKVGQYTGNSILFPFYAFYQGLLSGAMFVLSRPRDFTRLDGITLVERLCELASRRGYTVFFLGGRPRDSKGNPLFNKISLSGLTADKMREKYPQLNIVGYSSDFSSDSRDDTSAVEYIQQCMKEKDIDSIDFLFAAYNHPYQEKWIVRNAKSIPACVSIGVGSTFDVLSGYTPKMNPFLYNSGFGWVIRLIMQPWRYKRILRAFPLFPLKVYLHSLKQK